MGAQNYKTPVWPAPLQQLSEVQGQRLLASVWSDFRALLSQEAIDLDVDMRQQLQRLYLPLAAWLAHQSGAQPMVLGINGAQGSGKSTLAKILALLLEQAFDKTVISISIDDLYKTRAQRRELAETVHPLLATRGVPGTHDVELGIDLLTRLKQGVTSDLAIPVFDKASDERLPESDWTRLTVKPDIIIFEGWCVGAVAEDATSLQQPVNELESTEDADARWRSFVNEQLAGPYQQLFNLIDVLLMLRVPDFEKVYEWRGLQEQKLQASLPDSQQQPNNTMSEAELKHFIMHYERITRLTLNEMPSRADVVLALDADHRIAQVSARA